MIDLEKVCNISAWNMDLQTWKCFQMRGDTVASVVRIKERVWFLSIPHKA